MRNTNKKFRNTTTKNLPPWMIADLQRREAELVRREEEARQLPIYISPNFQPPRGRIDKPHKAVIDFSIEKGWSEDK